MQRESSPQGLICVSVDIFQVHIIPEPFEDVILWIPERPKGTILWLQTFIPPGAHDLRHPHELMTFEVYQTKQSATWAGTLGCDVGKLPGSCRLGLLVTASRGEEG